MSRGRLIFPVIAELRSPLSPADDQDPDFKEPRLRHATIDVPGELSTVEGPAVRLPCQVEPDEVAATDMHANGDATRSKINLVFHVRDVKAAKVIPKRQDRLVGLYSRKGKPLLDCNGGGGMYATEVRPISFGLGRVRSVANLLRVTFVNRTQGLRRNA